MGQDMQYSRTNKAKSRKIRDFVVVVIQLLFQNEFPYE